MNKVSPEENVSQERKSYLTSRWIFRNFKSHLIVIRISRQLQWYDLGETLARRVIVSQMNVVFKSFRIVKLFRDCFTGYCRAEWIHWRFHEINSLCLGVGRRWNSCDNERSIIWEGEFVRERIGEYRGVRGWCVPRGGNVL